MANFHPSLPRADISLTVNFDIDNVSYLFGVYNITSEVKFLYCWNKCSIVMCYTNFHRIWLYTCIARQHCSTFSLYQKFKSKYPLKQFHCWCLNIEACHSQTWPTGYYVFFLFSWVSTIWFESALSGRGRKEDWCQWMSFKRMRWVRCICKGLVFEIPMHGIRIEIINLVIAIKWTTRANAKVLSITVIKKRKHLAGSNFVSYLTATTSVLSKECKVNSQVTKIKIFDCATSK